jgi:hypothetical protein
MGYFEHYGHHVSDQLLFDVMVVPYLMVPSTLPSSTEG